MQFHNPFIQLNGCTIVNNEAQEYQQQLPQARQPVQQVKKEEPGGFNAWWGTALATGILFALVSNPGVVVLNNQAPPTTINNNFTSR
jgi:hypothetical protein